MPDSTGTPEEGYLLPAGIANGEYETSVQDLSHQLTLVGERVYGSYHLAAREGSDRRLAKREGHLLSSRRRYDLDSVTRGVNIGGRTNSLTFGQTLKFEQKGGLTLNDLAVDIRGSDAESQKHRGIEVKVGFNKESGVSNVSLECTAGTYPNLEALLNSTKEGQELLGYLKEVFLLQRAIPLLDGTFNGSNLFPGMVLNVDFGKRQVSVNQKVSFYALMNYLGQHTWEDRFSSRGDSRYVGDELRYLRSRLEITYKHAKQDRRSFDMPEMNYVYLLDSASGTFVRSFTDTDSQEIYSNRRTSIAFAEAFIRRIESLPMTIGKVPASPLGEYRLKDTLDVAEFMGITKGIISLLPGRQAQERLPQLR